MRRIFSVIACAIVGATLGPLACKGSGSGASIENVSISECDDYLAKMQACFAKDPDTKEQQEPGFLATKEAWAQRAKDPKEKAGLESTCKTMLSRFATSYPKCADAPAGASAPAAPNAT